jgi:type II secretory pathway pseudopilin PulG
MPRRPVNFPFTARCAEAFSLVELILVVAIMAVIGAMAASRLSNRVDDAVIAKMQADTVVLNNALDHYAAEHGGDYPDPDRIAAQLLTFTSAAGDTSPTKTSTHIFGPYLRSIPPLLLTDADDNDAIVEDPGDGDTVNGGWLYDPVSGKIKPNVTESQLIALDVSDATIKEVLGKTTTTRNISP